MTEIYLDKAQSDRVHALLIKRFWYEQFPGFDELVARVKMFQVSAEETALITAQMNVLLIEWGLRLADSGEPHTGLVFSNEAAYVQFLLRWS